MAQLKDLLVSGASRFIGKLFADEVQLTTLNIPTTSNGTTYGPGTSGQVLVSNGTSSYWKTLATSDVGSGTLAVGRGGTGATTVTPYGVAYGNSSGNAYTFTAAGTNGYLLQGKGSAAPAWVAQSSITAGLASALTNIVSSDAANSTTTQRYVWISYNNNQTGRPAYTSALTFQTSTGTLTATNFSGNGAGLTNLTAANISAGTLPIARGGTGVTTIGAYNVVYGNSAGNAYTGLGPNTTTTKKFLRMTGTGSAGAAPAWDTVTKSDVGLGNVANSTYAGGTAVTLNGTSKAASTASFYAPTGSGTANQVLISGGSNTAPSWTNQSNLSVGSAVTANKLGTNAGSLYQPVYFTNGVPTIGSGYTVEYIKGTQTASTNAWTGVTKDTALYDGKMIMYVLPYAGTSSGATLNLTLADGTTSGAKNIYRYGNTTAITTHYAANSRILLIYDATNNRWNSSAWYDSNSNTLLRVYASATNIEVPLIAQSSANSATANWTSYTGTYKDWYGAIPNDDTLRPKINLSTGKMTVPGGITANLVGNVTGSLTGPASKLGTETVGAADRPIYLSSGVATQTTYRMAGTNAVATTARAITDNLETGIWFVNGTNSSALYNQSDGVAYVNKYNDSWIGEIYQDYRTGQIAVRGKNNGTWQDWRKVLDSTNYSTWTVTKSGTGATGTWGISISGNAATATTAAKLDTNAGSPTQPIYFNNGIPVAITGNITNGTTGNAATASKATAANITTTANAVAYYTNTTGTFGSKASANGALYATSTNGTLTFGTLPVGQGGTGITSNPSMIINLENSSAAYVFQASPKPGVSGTLGTEHGGTGLTSFISKGILYATSTSALATTSAGASGQVLTSGGTGNPTWTTATNSNTASTIVKRDASGNFSAGTITANLIGRADMAHVADSLIPPTSVVEGNVWSILNSSGGQGWRSLDDGTFVKRTGDNMIGYLTLAGLKGSSNIDYGTALPTSEVSEGRIFFQLSNEQYEIPIGGQTGALLIKASSTDRDITWSPAAIYVNGSVLYGAAWNDYAEYRETTAPIEPGRVVIENGDDTLSLSTERMQPGGEIVSDTFGFAIGKTNKSETPVAASGRVLAYPNESRESYKPGQPVCSGPNGTVSQMTNEEAREYPWLIIGTVSAIPDYDTWGEDNIKVNGRIWIRIR